ncbi:protease pro-enzyme activation domain-containing protein [Granulicella mallensis]|uniref:Kumamolisin n=1 Tax=Granulicella mallensis TaxID=940614 RepID=A0A7W7ZT21_9BACT|nr:S53 family peptidase [Granulicella mallensis]MBB5065249.1 kumamolisin [Granulicella mallensis]
MPTSSRFASQSRVLLPGSERKPFVPAGDPKAAKTPKVSTSVKTVPAPGRIRVSLIVPPKQPLDTKRLGKLDARLSRAQFAARHGADPASVRLVKAFAKEFGLTVEPITQPGRCTVQLSGTCAAMQKAFGISLVQHTTEQGKFRLREGEISLPAELDGHVLAVLGLDNRPQAKPHFRIAKPRATNVSYTPVQVAQLYGFPAGATATGQTIGIIELGGGYRAADLTAYFKTLGLPAPTVIAVPVDGGKNTPGNANGADGEVMLDIEVCAAVAPGAKIAVYFTTNTDQGFIDAITTAVHDSVNKPSVISISWGGPESSWTQQSMTALDAACQAAAAVGVTITVAAGDNGSSDGASGDNVDFPASSPHVLACGGTKLVGSGSTITSEVVWNETSNDEGATGGGVSTVFALPTWQKNASVPAPTTSAGGRGVPDVSGDADPSTGYTIRVDSETTVIGGTSAVAPLWAGLIALANAQNKVAAGFVNPALYAAGAKKAFRDITQGNNGSFSAGPGWDACTGLGSPVGNLVIQTVAPKSTTAKKAKKGKTK